MLAIDSAGQQTIAELLHRASQAREAETVQSSTTGMSAEDILYSTLGARLQSHATDPAQTIGFGSNVELAFNLSFRDLGKGYFRRMQSALKNLLCGNDSETQDIRKKIAGAFASGREYVAGTIATAIATALGVAPAIATVLGALIVYLFFKPALEALCEAWTVTA